MRYLNGKDRRVLPRGQSDSNIPLCCSRPKLTKEIRVQILAVGVGHSLEGQALLLHGQLHPIWVDGGYNNDPGLIDQLQKGDDKQSETRLSDTNVPHF